jgi:hypothetical protein
MGFLTATAGAGQLTTLSVVSELSRLLRGAGQLTFPVVPRVVPLSVDGAAEGSILRTNLGFESPTRPGCPSLAPAIIGTMFSGCIPSPPAPGNGGNGGNNPLDLAINMAHSARACRTQTKYAAEHRPSKLARCRPSERCATATTGKRVVVNFRFQGWSKCRPDATPIRHGCADTST